MTGVEKCYRYCDWVEHNPSQTNKWVKLAVKRFRKDLSKVEDESYPFKFDEEKANRFCQFAECLKMSKDKWAGKCIELADWQAFIFCNIYGFVYKETGLRRFRKAFIYVGRKNGKSLMCAVPALWDLLSTNGAEVCCASNKREMSKRVWDDASNMVRQNPSLQKRLKIYESTSRIINERTRGVMEALSADKKNFDGKNPSVIIADELSAMTNMDVIKVLQSGQGSRPEPLLLEITSGSDDIYSAGKLEFDRSCKILQEVQEDNSYFCILYCLDENDDWTKEENWIKANPMLGVTVNIDTMRKLCIEAKQQPALQGEFICKQCARWSTPERAWIKPETWQKIVRNSEEYKLDLSKGHYSIGAIDLSKRVDLTAFTVCTYQDGKFFMEHRFYFPLEQLRRKIHTDNELWEYWTRQNYLTATEGSVVDYTRMYQDIIDLDAKYKLQEILFDPYNAQNTLIPELENQYTLVEVNQNMKTFSPMVKSFEEEIYKQTIVDGSPILRWMMSNAEVYTDKNDNIKIVKPDANANSNKRIDGVITSIMSLARIKQLIANNEIDLRTEEEIKLERQKMLASLKWN